jgi:transcriptional regulator with XRE-family HTH domain
VKIPKLAKNIGSLLRRLRLERGLSHEQLSKKSKVHRTYFSAIENGTVDISANLLSRICIGLDVALSRFFEILEIETETGEMVIPDQPRLNPITRRKKKTSTTLRRKPKQTTIKRTGESLNDQAVVAETQDELHN